MSTTIITLFQQAQQLHQQKQAAQAWETYQKLLQIDSTYLPGLLGLSKLLYQHKKYAEAIPYLERTNYLYPLAVEPLCLLGMCYSKTKNARAVPTWQQVVKLTTPDSPQHYEAMYQLAKVLRDKHDNTTAEGLIDRILKKQPDYAKALTLKGQFQQKREENELAYATFQRAVALMPQNAPANYNFACMARVLKKNEEAIHYFQKAIQLNPHWSEPLRELAALMSQEGQPNTAEQLLKKAITISPDNPENYRSIAQWYSANGDRRKAIKFYKKLTELLPEDVKAQAALGGTLAAVGAFGAAIPHLQKSLEMEANAQAALSLADSYASSGQLLEALPLIEQALELEPDFMPAIFQIITLRAKLCDWSQWEKDRNLWKATALQQLADEKHEFTLPLLDMNYYDLPMDLHLQLNKFAAEGAKKRAEYIIKQTQFTHQPRQRTRLRIGYLSPDFRHHPVGRIVQFIFQAHHREVVEVFAYSLSEARKGDDVRKAIKDGVNHFREMPFASNADVAKQIYQDEIDVLIDLGGYTAYARPEVVAAQPAPVQAHFLGYPNTSGADFLQYIIADEQLIPQSLEKYYAEKVVRLPHAFPGAIPKVKQTVLNRAAEGLPEDAFVFAGFNRPEKLDPEIFKSWLRIVNTIPNGLLWIGVSETVQQNLQAYAKTHGLNISRVKFSDWADYQTFLRRLRHTDLFLDTLHYGAGATAVASIAMGTPVLTTTRDCFTSRLAATVVSGANQEELICPDLASFEKKAIELALHPQKMNQLKAQLRDHPEQLPLFNMDTFATSLENAYLEMYRKFSLEYK